MKISKRELSQIIREEVSKLNEQAKTSDFDPGPPDTEQLSAEEAEEMENMAQSIAADIEPDQLTKIAAVLGAGTLPAALKSARGKLDLSAVDDVLDESFLTTKKKEQLFMLAETIDVIIEAAYELSRVIEGEQVIDFNKSKVIEDTVDRLDIATEYLDKLYRDSGR